MPALTASHLRVRLSWHSVADSAQISVSQALGLEPEHGICVFQHHCTLGLDRIHAFAPSDVGRGPLQAKESGALGSMHVEHASNFAVLL